MNESLFQTGNRRFFKTKKLVVFTDEKLSSSNFVWLRKENL